MCICTGFATRNANEPLAAFSFNRRDPRTEDVEIEILYCGVCHSDLHQARDEWHNTVYTCLPGHEIVGRVTKTGAEATLFKTGDLAAVGCMVNSCREGLEQFCERGFNPTYNGVDKVIGGPTFGRYSNAIVVDEDFVLRISGKLDLAGVAPLLCAGITTYSPLRHWRVGPGQKAGIVGLGGLGHMGVKFAHAFGAHTVLLTTSPSKVKDGKRLGADEVVISKNPVEMAAHADSFCAEHQIIAGVEIIPIQKINEAYERMLRSDVKYRFSIDMSSLSRAA